MPAYRNTSFATAASLSDVLSQGTPIVVRGRETRELLARVTQLRRPAERYVLLPRRLNDVFQQFAETMWMLAGRDDVAWLQHYLPNAGEHSDDGLVWRGAYGPRLRRWTTGTDQVERVLDLLRRDPTSRRAVMVLFDPARDFADSLDIPCNNWLSWMARDGRLHLCVGVRSNDALWGFSGINAFEWSVLQEMMAHWLGLEVGEAAYLASSFHLYADKYGRAAEIVDRFHGISPYDHVVGIRFETSWENFPQKLQKWFETEERLRRNPDPNPTATQLTGDPFLDSGLALVRLKWGKRSGWPPQRLAEELGRLPDADFAVAAYEYFARKDRDLLERIPQPGIAAFFSACQDASAGTLDRFKEGIVHLHDRKDTAYGAAWKRRGESVSILPNIARKIDRLEQFMRTGGTLVDESVLDTAVDLFVYAAKYRLFLAEQEGDGAYLAVGARQPLSDHFENFAAVVERFELGAERTLETSIGEAIAGFDNLWQAAEVKEQLPARAKRAESFLRQTEAIVAAVYRARPGQVTNFIRAEFSA